MGLVLGDNIFYGYGFSELLCHPTLTNKGGAVFGYRVKQPEHFGVVEFDDQIMLSLWRKNPLLLDLTTQLPASISMTQT